MTDYLSIEREALCRCAGILATASGRLYGRGRLSRVRNAVDRRIEQIDLVRSSPKLLDSAARLSQTSA